MSLEAVKCEHKIPTFQNSKTNLQTKEGNIPREKTTQKKKTIFSLKKKKKALKREKGRGKSKAHSASKVSSILLQWGLKDK